MGPKDERGASRAGRVGMQVAVLAGLGLFESGRATADDAKVLSLGRHLAGECTACHRIDGVENGIPSITGWPAAHFEATMEFYRTGARPNPVMVSVAQSLDEAQTRALAAYYGSLPKPPRKP